MDARLDEDKTELSSISIFGTKLIRTSWTYLGVLVFLVALEVLANSDSLFDEHVAVSS